MKKIALSALLIVGGVTMVTAQQTSTIVMSPPGGSTDFCYFSGLAYSENALQIIEVPNRRESPIATQKALIECTREDGSETLTWKRLEAE